MEEQKVNLHHLERSLSVVEFLKNFLEHSVFNGPQEGAAGANAYSWLTGVEKQIKEEQANAAPKA